MSDVPEGYRMSEVGVIPEEWEVKTLGECLLKKPDYGINAAAVPYSDNLPVYIRITDISDDGKFLPAGKTSVNNIDSNKFLLEKDDIVFARTGASTGKTYLYSSNDGELVFAGFLIRVKVNPNKLIASYLKSYTETGTYWNWVKIMSMRSGQPGINGNEYAQLQIPLPPLHEQQAIASALSDVDALITALEQLITKKRNIKQGAMQQLITGKKRLPGFGGAWEVKKLGEIAEITMGQSPQSAFYNTNGNGIPLIQGNADIEDRKTIIRTFTSSITKRCKMGDIIMSVRAPVGEIAKATFDACLGRGVCAISTKNDYLFHSLIFLENSWLRISKGSTFDSINSTDVIAVEIKMPPTEIEQQAIAQILSNMDAELEALEQKRDKYKAIKQGMMQELLTGKRRLA
jgi:type I restriction enzyme S subunit